MHCVKTDTVKKGVGMSFFQRSLLGYFVAVFMSAGMLAPMSWALPTQGVVPAEFAHKDRLSFATNVFNLAVDAFNGGGVSDFMQVIKAELEPSEQKHLGLVLRSADRLPNAYIVGIDKVKFFYIQGNSFNEAGLLLDFSKISEGILEVNGKAFSYNRALSYSEWFEILKNGDSDLVSYFELVPQAHAFLAGLLAAIGALFSGLFGGGKNKKSTSAPSVASRAPTYRGGSWVSRRKGGGVGSVRRPMSKKHYVGNSSRSIASSEPKKKKSSSSRKSDYVRAVGSSTGSKVGSVARSLWGHVDTSDWPKKTLKCAQQASTILKRAGIIDGTFYTVVGLVKHLKTKGWRVSNKPVVGAVAFSNPEFNTDSSRSHVGVVGSDLAVYHNSGAAGGKIIRSAFGDTDYNGRWLNGVDFLIPPSSASAMLKQGGINVRMAYLAQFNS